MGSISWNKDNNKRKYTFTNSTADKKKAEANAVKQSRKSREEGDKQNQEKIKKLVSELKNYASSNNVKNTIFKLRRIENNGTSSPFPNTNHVKKTVLQQAVKTIYGSNTVNEYTNVNGNIKKMPQTIFALQNAFNEAKHALKQNKPKSKTIKELREKKAEKSTQEAVVKKRAANNAVITASKNLAKAQQSAKKKAEKATEKAQQSAKVFPSSN